MNRSDVICILIIHWTLFALAFIGFAAHMETRNLNKQIEYMQYYKDAINSADLQDIMCNGSPVG
jgi:hypothetical protein